MGERDNLESTVANETSQLLLSRKKGAYAKNCGQIIPDIISKDKIADLETESVNVSKDSIIFS